MAKTLGDELAAVIAHLQQQRQEYVAALAEIDRIFKRCGIEPAPAPKPSRQGRRAAKQPTARARRRRPQFSKTATQSILDLVRQGGRKGVGSSAIAAHWKSEGRAGQPYVTLGKLVKARKLRRQDLKGQRGSQYFIA